MRFSCCVKRGKVSHTPWQFCRILPCITRKAFACCTKYIWTQCSSLHSVLYYLTYVEILLFFSFIACNINNSTNLIVKLLVFDRDSRTTSWKYTRYRLINSGIFGRKCTWSCYIYDMILKNQSFNLCLIRLTWPVIDFSLSVGSIWEL